jgi:hypothetical protein
MSTKIYLREVLSGPLTQWLQNIVAMFKHSSTLGQQKMKVASLIGTFHCTGKIFAALIPSTIWTPTTDVKDYALRSCEYVHSAAQSTLTTVHGGFPRRHPPITASFVAVMACWVQLTFLGLLVSAHHRGAYFDLIKQLWFQWCGWA